MLGFFASRWLRLALLIIPELFLPPRCLEAQTWEDGEGRSTLLRLDGAGITVNLQDASTRVGYGSLRSGSRLFWGVSLKAKSNAGIGALLGGGNLAPGAGIATYVGGKNICVDNLYIALVGAYERSNVVLLYPDHVPDSQVVKSWFDGLDVGIHIWTPKVPGVDVAIGVAGGYRRLHNYKDLKEGELVTVRSVRKAPTEESRELRTIEKGRLGDYAEEYAMFMSGDIAWQLPGPFEDFGLRGYGRWIKPRATDGERVNVGLDVMLLRRKDLLLRRVGVIFTLEDLQRNRVVPVGEAVPSRFKINVVATFPFRI